MLNFKNYRLILAVLVAQPIHANLSEKLGKLQIMNFWAGQVLKTLRKPLQVVIGSKMCESSPDASELVTKFCQSRCQTHGIKDVQVKINGAFGPMATVSSYIMFAEACARQLEDALGNINHLDNQKIIELYCTLLDHEISHLKNHDVKKRAALNSTIYAATGVAIWRASQSKLSWIFQQPANFKEALKNSMALGMINFVQDALVSGIDARYAKMQELRADRYATEHASSPVGPNFMASFLETIEVDFLTNFILKNQIPSGAQNDHVAFASIIRAYLVSKFHKEIGASYTTTEFKAWLNQHAWAVSAIRELLDPCHPASQVRIAQIKKILKEKEANSEVAAIA